MILILTDSLGLPRSAPEQVRLIDTYPQLLEQRFGINNYHMGQPAATVRNVANNLNYFDIGEFQHIVLHFGIVDCAPRPFNKYENALLGKLPIPNRLDYCLRKYRNITKTRHQNFLETCCELERKCQDKLIVIPISFATDQYEIKLPNITHNVKKFNATLSTVFKNKVLPLTLNGEDFMSDEHHLSTSGHLKVARALKQKLK